MAAVMVVDDDPDVRDYLVEIVSEAGHDVVPAEGGIHALDILDTGRPVDLMVTDVIMPGLNGFNLARMAKLRRPSLKVLYLTGFSETERVRRDAGEHYGKLLQKPIMPADFRREVDAALSGKATV